MLITIRYGHIWREKANLKHAYNNDNSDEKHDDKSSPSELEKEKDEEAAISSASSDGHHDEHHDTPGSLVALNPGKVGRGKDRLDLSRTSSSRTELPDVEEVLKRTVSLGGASVHGGG